MIFFGQHLQAMGGSIMARVHASNETISVFVVTPEC